MNKFFEIIKVFLCLIPALVFACGLAGLIFSLFTKSSSVLLFVMAGPIFASPSLILVYFPLSIWIWLKKPRNWYQLLFYGPAAALLNGALFIGIDGGVKNAPMMYIFAGTAFVTVLLHFMFLYAIDPNHGSNEQISEVEV